MANYPFKINIQFKDGSTKPHYTSSFATDADTVVSASVMVDKINLIPLGNAYTQDSVAVAMHPSRKFGLADEGHKWISASYTHANTGSVIFTDTEDTDNGGLDFYTFWGTKVCNVLGLPEGIPIYTETFKLSDDSSNPSNYLSGDVIADGIAIKESFKMAPQSRMRSNLIWDHQFGEGFLQWVSGSNTKFIFGYDDQEDEFLLQSIGGSGAASFKIEGVDTIEANTARILDLYTPEIYTDGSLGSGMHIGKGAIAILYGEAGTTTDHSFQAGDIKIVNGGLYAQRDSTSTFVQTVGGTGNATDTLFQLVLRNNTDTAGAFAGIAFQVENGFNSDRINAAILAERVDSGASDVNSDLVFATNSDADDDLYERMRITSDGKVGIGRVARPMNILHVSHSGTDGDDGIMIVRGDSATTAGESLGGIGFDSTDGNVPSSVYEASAYIGAIASETHGVSDKGGHLVFGTAALNENDDVVSNEVGRWTDGGNLLIGRTAEAYTTKDPVLECDGYISFDGFMERAGTAGSDNGTNVINFHWDGSNLEGWVDITEVVSVITSDYRIKENVSSMTGSFSNGILKKINALNPIHFTQKSCSIYIEDSTQRASFYAHEMAEQFPNIVKGEYNATGSDGTPIFQGYKNEQLVTYLVKAVQELTQAHNSLIAAITGSSDLNQLKASVTGSLIG